MAISLGPRFQLINDHKARVGASSSSEQALDSLVALGIHRGDGESQVVMREKIIQALSPETIVLPSANDPGVFFLYDLNGYSDEEKVAVIKDIRAGLSSRKPAEHLDPIAVFKIGAKRAQMELTVRKISHLLGLSKYAIPAAFFSLKDPDFKSWSHADYLAQEDLWNGMIKEYLGTQKKDQQVLGILEPFCKPSSHSKQKQKELFIMMLTLSLAVGLRDGRDDNVNEVIIDSEECMPNRLDPRTSPFEGETLQDEVAATHLPFLDKSFFEQPINHKDFIRLREIVLRWDIDRIFTEIASEQIQFADLLSELFDMGDDLERTIADDGGCSVKLLREEEVFADDGLYSPTNLSSTQYVFNPSQMDAFRTRLNRLKTFIVNPKNEKVMPAQIVGAVDPFYLRHLRLMQTKQEMEKEEILIRDESVSSVASGSSLQRSSAGRESPFMLAGRWPVSPGIMDLNHPGDLRVASRQMRERLQSERSSTFSEELQLLEEQSP